MKVECKKRADGAIEMTVVGRKDEFEPIIEAFDVHVDSRVQRMATYIRKFLAQEG